MLTSAENYMASIEAMQSDPNVDIVLLQEALPRERGSDRAESYIRMVEQYAATKAKKPIAFVTPTSHGHTDYSRALRAKAPHVSFLQEANKALRAIASAVRREEIERIGRAPAASPATLTPEQRETIEDVRALARELPMALDEVQSKDVLRAYGIVTPAEALVTSPAEAVEAAKRIGFPVVLKAVSDTLTHKSDVGARRAQPRDAGGTDRGLRGHGAKAA